MIFLTDFLNNTLYFYVLLFSLLNKMPNKKLFTAKKVAQWLTHSAR